MTSTSRHAQFDDRAFGHRLRIARIVLGVTEREAAAAVGRTLPTWLKYERTGEGRCIIPLLRFVQRSRKPRVASHWQRPRSETAFNPSSWGKPCDPSHVN
jgi:hypothetical protein